MLIATKAGLTRTGPDQWIPVGRPAYLRQQAELSLRRLKLERIELFQLHRIDPKVPLADQFGVLKALQDEGKVGAIGLSEVSVDEIKAAREIAEIATVQNRYNLTNRQSEDVLRYCEPRASASSRGSRSRPATWPSPAARSTTSAGHRRDAVAGGAGLAAGHLAGDPADPGHVEGRPPGGEHRRRRLQLTDEQVAELTARSADRCGHRGIELIA